MTGEAIATHLTELAKLRILVFRDYPYLYEGDLSYEEKYLAAFAQSPNAVIVGAFADDQLVGAATGSPLCYQEKAFRDPFSAPGYQTEEIFYFGESVLLKEYRGRGIGHLFFDRREEHARSLPEIRHCAFCAVVRSLEHPARPAQYQPLDRFWKKRGYAPLEGITTRLSWRELEEPEESDHTMQFWMRSLI